MDIVYGPGYRIATRRRHGFLLLFPLDDVLKFLFRVEFLGSQIFGPFQGRRGEVGPYSLQIRLAIRCTRWGSVRGRAGGLSRLASYGRGRQQRYCNHDRHGNHKSTFHKNVSASIALYRVCARVSSKAAVYSGGPRTLHVNLGLNPGRVVSKRLPELRHRTTRQRHVAGECRASPPVGDHSPSRGG